MSITSDYFYNDFADQLFLLDLVKSASENSEITSVKYIELSGNIIATIGDENKPYKHSVFSKFLMKAILFFSYLEEADGEKPIRTTQSSKSAKSIEKLILLIIHGIFDDDDKDSLYSKTTSKVKKENKSIKNQFNLEKVTEDIFKYSKTLGLETSKTFILDLIKHRRHPKNKIKNLGVNVLPYFQNILTYPESMLFQNIDLFNKYNPDKTVSINISDCDPKSQKKFKELIRLKESIKPKKI